MTDILKFPKGTALIFTTGEYSDFGFAGELVTIRDCDLPALAQQFDAEERAKNDHWLANASLCNDFAASLREVAGEVKS